MIFLFYFYFSLIFFIFAVIFAGEEGILQTSMLKRGEFGISALTSIHAAVVASDLRKGSSQHSRQYLPSANL